MICDSCKVQNHETCLNEVNAEGELRDTSIILTPRTWCDCQHMPAGSRIERKTTVQEDAPKIEESVET